MNIHGCMASEDSCPLLWLCAPQQEALLCLGKTATISPTGPRLLEQLTKLLRSQCFPRDSHNTLALTKFSHTQHQMRSAHSDVFFRRQLRKGELFQWGFAVFHPVLQQQQELNQSHPAFKDGPWEREQGQFQTRNHYSSRLHAYGFKKAFRSASAPQGTKHTLYWEGKSLSQLCNHSPP